MADEGKPVVLDTGSGFIKAGFAGEHQPQCCFPNVVGLPKHKEGLVGTDRHEDLKVGDAAVAREDDLDLSAPVERGRVVNFDDIEDVWSYTLYNKLNVQSTEHSIQLCEAPLTPARDRERMTQTMFERYSVPALYSASQAVLSLYAYGNTDGIVLESGHGVTHAVPVRDGYALPDMTSRLELGGKDLDSFLSHLLGRRGTGLGGRSELMGMISEIKTKLCYVAMEYEKELKTPSTLLRLHGNVNMEYILPDGQPLKLDHERFLCPEVMFQPSLGGHECRGVHKIVCDAIVKCDEAVRTKMSENIVLAGGNTTLSGFSDRLSKEVREILPADLPCKVRASGDRLNAAWVGGSIFASLPAFAEMAITKSEYDESGPIVIHKKCPVAKP